MRCGEVTALYVASIMDMDQCTNPGCSFPNGWAVDSVKLVSWSDNGAGGDFGYLDAQGNFVPSGNINEITRYKAPDSPQRTGVVHITLTVDDEPLWANDPAATNPQNVGNLTVWEFTISNTPGDWIPTLDADLSFIATIRPDADHYGNSMASRIEFRLLSSRERGYCLNATREQNPHQWNDTRADDTDLKFPPNQPLEVSSLDTNPLNYTIAWTVGPETTAPVTVRCLDYGAYGYIDALADLPDAPMSVARREGTLPQDFEFGAWIPIDESPYNYIADAWQWNNGAASDDDENTPVGATRGDGFSRYEEYRGFMVRNQPNQPPTDTSEHRRLNPTVKDVFVHVPSSDIQVLGINTSGFADFTALGVTIHVPDTTLGGVLDWVVNALHGADPNLHLMDQRAIVLMDGGRSANDALMGSANGSLPNRTDCSIYTQSIRFLHHGDTVNWDATCREQRRRVIGHECGHGVNLYTDDHVNPRHTIANGFPAGCVMNLDRLWNAIPHAYCANSPDGGCQNLWRLRPPPP